MRLAMVLCPCVSVAAPFTDGALRPWSAEEQHETTSNFPMHIVTSAPAVSRRRSGFAGAARRSRPRTNRLPLRWAGRSLGVGLLTVCRQQPCRGAISQMECARHAAQLSPPAPFSSETNNQREHRKPTINASGKCRIHSTSYTTRGTALTEPHRLPHFPSFRSRLHT